MAGTQRRGGEAAGKEECGKLCLAKIFWVLKEHEAQECKATHRRAK